MQLFCTPSFSTSRQFVAAIVSLLLHSEGLSSTEFTSSSSTFLLLGSRVSGSGILSIVSSLKSFASMPYFSSLRDRVYNKWILTRFFNDDLRNYFPERLKCSDINELRNICGENHQKKLHKTSCQTSSEGSRPGFESSCVSPTLHIGPGRTREPFALYASAQWAKSGFFVQWVYWQWQYWCFINKGTSYRK